MTDQTQPTPESPQDEGIDPSYPDQSRQEGAHLLANQARERLRDRGFSDEQIFEWATAFSEEEGGGSVDGLVEYIARKEREGA